MHFETVIERVWICTRMEHDHANLDDVIRRVWRPWLKEHRDALQGCDRVSLEMHLNAKINGRLEQYLEAVNGRHARCWHCIDQFVYLQLWECDVVTLNSSSPGEQPRGGQFRREPCQKLKLHWGVNFQSWQWMEDSQSWVDAVVHGVCCTQWMLYLVKAVVGVGCSQCVLYSVFAILGVYRTHCILYPVLTHNHGIDRCRGMT